MNVVLIVDGRGIQGATLTIKSVLFTSMPSAIHVIDAGMSLLDAETLRTLSPKIRIVEIAEDVRAWLLKFSLHGSEHVSSAAYAKLQLHRLLPDVDRAIYLDTDTVVLRDLAPLNAFDLGDSMVGASWTASQVEVGRARLGLQGRYFNSGVMLCALRRWREEDAGRQFLAWYSENHVRMKFNDQEILNGVFDRRNAEIGKIWNVSHWEVLRGPNQAGVALNSIAVLHFNGPYKPWHADYEAKMQLHPPLFAYPKEYMRRLLARDAPTRHATVTPSGKRVLDVRHLELHVAHACNLVCESCAHYSNHGHKGVVSLEDATRWLAGWKERIAPRLFTLLGGEPTIHPDLERFFRLARDSWPHAGIRMVTNGFFLHRHPALPLLLKDDPKMWIQLSVHHRSEAYTEKLKPVMDLVEEWVSLHGIRIDVVKSHDKWTRRYHGYGEEMMPFAHGNPRKSWEVCPAKTSPQLSEGKIWKCAPLAYLPMQAEKYSLNEAWNPYLEYQPLSPDCSDDELAAFFGREEERFCGMCAAEQQLFVLPDPIPVTRRKAVSPSA